MPYTKTSCWLLAAAIGLFHANTGWAQPANDASATTSVDTASSSPQPASPAAAQTAEPEPALPEVAPQSKPPSPQQPVAANAVNAPAAASDEQPQMKLSESEPETLLGPHYKVGGFGGIGVMYTRFAKNDAVQVCGEGALLLNHVFSIGFGGCGIARTLKTTSFDSAADPDHRTSFGYGGGIIRYHFFSHRFANLALATLVGAGGIASGDWNYRTNEYYEEDQHPDFVFVFEPQLAGYVNITRWLRIGATAGYRFVASNDTRGLKNSDLAAPTIGGQIQAGWF